MSSFSGILFGVMVSVLAYGLVILVLVLRLKSEEWKNRQAAIRRTEERWRELNGANARHMKQLRARLHDKPGAVSLAAAAGGELSHATGRGRHARRR